MAPFLIQTKESRKQATVKTKVDSTSLPFICASFLADDPSLLPYFAGSYLFFALIFGYLFFNRQLLFPIAPDRSRQFIDIEFVSNADFQNKQDLLPSTIPRPSVGKRVSPDNTTVTPETLAPPAQANPSQNQPQHREFTYTISCPRRTTVDAINSIARLPVKAKSTTENSIDRQVKQPSTQLDLEEVSPLEMTEIKDNDGDNSLELWQDGGRSSQGLGTTSTLANYLKELHKKLKHSWSPPSGPAHHIKVLFRLAADGSIVSLQLAASSGDNAADNSALIAVSKAAPFGKLPTDYPGRFLDLVYTFNYSTDELRELPVPKE